MAGKKKKAVKTEKKVKAVKAEKKGNTGASFDFTVMLAGEAGSGVQSIETTLVHLLKAEGYNVFATKEYMSRVRGGVNSTTLRISDAPVRALSGKTDIFIPLDNDSYERYKGMLSKAYIIGDKTKISYDKTINIPFNRIASEFGNALFANTVASGVVCGILDTGKAKAVSYIEKLFLKKGEETSKKNGEAMASGHEIGEQLRKDGIVKIEVKKGKDTSQDYLLAGSDAVAIGAIAGGCNAVFAYPMTPSSSVFTALSGYSTSVDIAHEQVEDEIGVINMALGCWYAGGRALVSTSGGGFALMTEGISMAGITETPVVVHLAQRPGPATGLPTRTEQGDLNLALYAGHGEFPRIILAPGNIEQAFKLSADAFNLADKYQVPVFILTDQYFVDTYYNVPSINTDLVRPESAVTETAEGYKRYLLSKDGLSPRGIPGFGKGFVCADSDEHDETGRITEDLDGISLSMKNKRIKKAATVAKAAFKPVLEGPEKYKNLVICWGSTYETVKEALKKTGSKETAMLFFPQLYPVHPSAAALIKKAKKVRVVENNQAGNFADLLEKETGIPLKDRVLKYNGLQFTVAELSAAVKFGGK